MRRKTVTGIVPTDPKKVGKIITAQQVDDILILNLWKDRILRARHCINSKTLEYETWDAQTDIWNGKNLEGAMDLSTYERYWYGKKDRYIFSDKDEERMALKLIKPDASREQDVIDLIIDLEERYNRNRREDQLTRRWRRIEELMRQVPREPDDLRDWLWQQVSGRADYCFKGEDGAFVCTSCGARFELPRQGKRNVKDKEMIDCPVCGKKIQVRKRANKVDLSTHCMLIQEIDAEKAVARHFDCNLHWDKDGREVDLSEAVRIILYRRPVFGSKNPVCNIYWGQHTREWSILGEHSQKFYDKKGYANRQMYAGYLYPTKTGEILKGTAYETWGRLFEQMAAAGVRCDYNRLMCCVEADLMVGLAEYLFKGRFYQLLLEVSTNISQYTGEVYGVPLQICPECTIDEVFRIDDIQKINRIREINGGIIAVRWMQWSEEQGKKISDKALHWLQKNKIFPEDTGFICDRMSPEQIMNYVTRQQSESYKTRSANGVLQQWHDYLDMCRRLKLDTDDPMVYRARELKRRHDAVSEEIREQQMIQMMQRNREMQEQESARMREKYPRAEAILKEITPKYEYQGEEYIITVPQTLMDIVMEGYALHHCVGNTDRYFDRIAQRETYICFLRKTEKPDVPYYTIEVEPGGTIRQHRGYLDEEPEIELIKPFLRKWQQVLKKRLGRQDHEYARISREKRQKNIEELQAANNTRVLQGLAEDFMEAI